MTKLTQMLVNLLLASVTLATRQLVDRCNAIDGLMFEDECFTVSTAVYRNYTFGWQTECHAMDDLAILGHPAWVLHKNLRSTLVAWKTMFASTSKFEYSFIGLWQDDNFMAKGDNYNLLGVNGRVIGPLPDQSDGAPLRSPVWGGTNPNDYGGNYEQHTILGASTVQDVRDHEVDNPARHMLCQYDDPLTVHRLTYTRYRTSARSELFDVDGVFTIASATTLGDCIAECQILARQFCRLLSFDKTSRRCKISLVDSGNVLDVTTAATDDGVTLFMRESANL